MDAVKAFNSELSSLYEVKPPISKAKMTALTRGAIKAIKFYKHVVQSVEKFILKCKSEYKVPGLYVIDSIVRQSRHQFGSDKDVFAPRFSKNMQQTFINLFKCPPEDKSKIIRVLNLWQKNQVFPPEVIQPLFDFADPNNPIYKELSASAQQPSNGLNSSGAVITKGSPALQRTPTKGNQPGNENLHGTSSNLNLTDPNVLQQLQQLQRLLTKNVENARAESQVHFDKKLLDFDYGDDEDEVNPSPRPQPSNNDSVTSLLTNPEVLRQLQTLQQTMAGPPPEMDMDKMRKLQEMKQQEDEFDKHLAQTVPNLPFASECEFKPSNTQMMSGYFMPTDMNPPPPSYQTLEYEQQQQLQQQKAMVQDNGPDVEVITLDHDDSRSGTPGEERYGNNRRRRSRSRSRDRSGRRDRDRKRRSRSRSANRRHRSRSRDRNRLKEKKEEERKETEKDRERKKRGLPVIKKDHLSVCSTTLWVGHLSKLVHQDDLSNTFGEFGDVVSIDLIPPRGCAFIVMLRRQDAARCLGKLKGHIIHGKPITLAWAPGKGVKGKDLKDYWEGDLGVSYIPHTKIKEDIDIEMLEDGGMIDEDTMPTWMKEKMERMGKKPISLPKDLPSFMMGGDMSNTSGQIDTSQPPPLPGGGLLQPPLLPLVSPFQFNNRLLGMNVPPGLMHNMSNMPNMPNIPIGVPPPNMPTQMMPNQLLGIGSPFQGPPGMLPPQMTGMDNKLPTSTTESSLQSLTESLMSIAQPFGLIPQPPAPHDDNMDIEMEDAEKGMDKPMSLSEQLQQMAGQYNRPNRDDRKDRRDGRDDRERRRSRSRDRERERDRDRDRDRDRMRDRHNSRDRDRRERDNSRGRDRDRRDDRRDRSNRWSDRDRDRERDRREPREPENKDEKREREKNLNDRLREMAGMGSYDEPRRDRSSRDRRNSDSNSRNFPPATPPPHGPDGPPPKGEEDFMRGSLKRPPPRGDFPNQRGSMEDFPPPALDAPPMPPMLRCPPDMMDDGLPNQDRVPDISDLPPDMMEGPPILMDEGAPNMNNGPGHRGNMMEGLPMLMDDGPPDIMEGPSDMLPHMRRDGPPHMRMDGPLDMPPLMRMDGPPDMPPHMRMDGPLDMPPHMRMDGLPDMPPHMRMDGLPDIPPHMRMDGLPDMPPHMRMDGPPDMPPHMRMDGPPDIPPHMRMDGPPDMPPHMRLDGPLDMPPHMRMDGPPDMPPHMRMDGPPHRMHSRGDMEHDNFIRGSRRDFGPRGMRGPQDFFPRDDFGPRGPPMMRGGPDFGPRGPDFGPRGHMGPRGPRGQFFGPRGHRPRGPFRDGPPNFNQRFDGPPRFDGPSHFDGPPPEFFRGPRGPPPMFDDGPPHPRHRGPPRFEDRRRGRPGPDFNPDFMDRGPSGGPPFDRPERPERRSRWGGGSPPRDEQNEDMSGPVLEEAQEFSGRENENAGESENPEGANTPVRDECPPPVDNVENFEPVQEGTGADEPLVEEPSAE